MDATDNQTPLGGIEHIAAISTEAIYVIDFQKKGFHFVADHPFLLCGYSVEEILSLGFDFYLKIVHNDDWPLVTQIRTAVLQRLSSMSDSGDINYFSFTIRLKHYSEYMMAYHKLKPMFVDGQLKFGVCLLSSSVLKTSGHLCAHHSNGRDYEEYVWKGKNWQKKRILPLTKREKEILRLAHCGKTGKEAADKLHIAYSTLRNMQASIFQKLAVRSMMNAVIYAFSHQLIFEYPNHPKQEAQTTPKRTRRLMTPDMMQRIQEGLNNRQSINSIAKREQTSESTIRYYIDKGQLKKP